MTYPTPTNHHWYPDDCRYLARPLSLRHGSRTIHLPALLPQALGDPSFVAQLQISYPYLCGAMANGISSVDLVLACAKAGIAGFFGAAGLRLAKIEEAITTLQTRCPGTFGFNLIHSPFDQLLEKQTVELYLKHGITLIEASAFMDVTLPLVKYRVTGIRQGTDGEIIVPNRVIVKVSRQELVKKFFSPPPLAMLEVLYDQGVIDNQQLELAKQIPLANYLTAEADSGGHTDKQALVSILPTFIHDKQQLQKQYRSTLHVGAAGGIADPYSALAAFAMGASYIVSGSINQACIEAATSTTVKHLLSQAKQADITMCPAADMFEMGIKVQVLKKGTMFPMRAQKLYEIYRSYSSIENLPADLHNELEEKFFRQPLTSVWQEIVAYFTEHDRQQLVRAEKDNKHKLALLCRSYLGQSSNWANSGVSDRQVDYQIWCGASMGVFNSWVEGSYLADPGQRRVAEVSLNILYYAALLARLQNLHQQGYTPRAVIDVKPLPLAELRSYLENR